MRRVWEGMNLMDGSKKKGNSSLEGDRNGFQMIWTSFTLDLIVVFFGMGIKDMQMIWTSFTLHLIAMTFKVKSRTDLISYLKEALCNLKKMELGKAPGHYTVLHSVFKNWANQ